MWCLLEPQKSSSKSVPVLETPSHSGSLVEEANEAKKLSTALPLPQKGKCEHFNSLRKLEVPTANCKNISSNVEVTIPSNSVSQFLVKGIS